MNKKIIILTAAMLASFGIQASAKYNKYNEESYINLYNNTIADIALSLDMTLDDFKSEFNLPEDMPGDTNETAAYFHLSINDFALVQGSSADETVAYLSKLTDKEITKETIYKDAEEGILFKTYLEKIEELKPEEYEEYYKSYGLENITDETSFAEARNQLHRVYLKNSGILSYFKKDSILVMLNGKYIDFDVAPVIMNDRVMVPMRNIFEALGSVVNWDGETKTVFASKGDKIITIQVGQNFMFLNNEKIEIDSPSVIVDERTLVPLRAVAEALDTQVFYNEDTKTVVIH